MKTTLSTPSKPRASRSKTAPKGSLTVTLKLPKGVSQRAAIAALRFNLDLTPAGVVKSAIEDSLWEVDRVNRRAAELSAKRAA